MGLDTSLLHLPKYRTPEFLVRSRTAFFFPPLLDNVVLIYINRAKEKAFFFFKEVNFISRTCVFLISNAVF